VTKAHNKATAYVPTCHCTRTEWRNDQHSDSKLCRWDIEAYMSVTTLQAYAFRTIIKRYVRTGTRYTRRQFDKTQSSDKHLNVYM